MTIYLDIILIENIIMNYIIIFATSYIMKVKPKIKMMFFSSVLGGIYALISYLQLLEVYSSMISKVILSICMVYIAFKPKNIKILLKYLVVFYLVSFLFGGCAFALLYFIKPEDVISLNGIYVGTYPIKIVLLGGVIGCLVIYFAFKIIKNRGDKNVLIYEIEIFLDGENMKTKAMLDTGNLLKDPISRAPVVVVQKDVLKSIIPNKILENNERIVKGEWLDCEEYLDFRLRIRLIPYTSIGKQNGMLLGFKVDKIKIKTEIDEKECVAPIVCVFNETLSKTKKYSALIGLDILE